MIAESAVHVEVTGRSDPNFDFILSPDVGDDLPVVDARREADVGYR